MTMHRLRLFDWGPSPFCMKIRAILDYKGLEYERVMVLGRPMIELVRRGGIGKVPALDIDGELVCDSTDIAHAIEQRFPTPPILPREPDRRALCHVLEDWADESVYYVNLYYQWIDPRGAPMVARAFERFIVGRAVLPLYRRMVTRQIRGQGTGRKPAAHVRRDLDRHLDAFDDLLAARDFLLGDGPFLCDFSAAAQLHYLSRTPVGGEALATRPRIASYRERMRTFRRER
ncbi:MAG TPA: glutathione S-transferase family protein [Nannocystaceae bacterium]|nr:glutathione S-transferase family protein [Nannocystaceae bacterium]